MGREPVHRQLVPFHDAIQDVLQEVVAIDAHDFYPHRIQHFGIRDEIVDGDDGIALFRGHPDGDRAVAAVDGHVTARILEADDFAAGHRVTVGAEGVLRLRKLVQVVLDLAAGLVGGDGVLPIRLGMGRRVGADFHAVSALEFGPKGGQPAVDAGIAGVVAKVHRIGEVERCGALGQGDRLAIRGERHDILVVEGGPDAAHQGFGVLGQLLEDVGQALEPLLLAVQDAAVVGLEAHFVGGHVEFFDASVGIQEAEMDGLVAIRLRLREVVDQAARLLAVRVREQGVHPEDDVLVGEPPAARGVDFPVHDLPVEVHPDVVLERNVVEVATALLHLPPDREGLPVPHAPADVTAHFAADEIPALVHKGVQRHFRALTVLFQEFLDPLVFQGIQELEGQILQFGLDLEQAQTAGQRREEELRLGRYLPLLLGLQARECPHVVQAVGELQEKHPHVALDRAQDVLEIVHLPLVRLGHRRDQEGHVVPETVADFLDGMGRVLHDVVQQGGGDDRRPLLPHLLHDHERHGQRMQDVRQAAVPCLRGVRLLCQLEGVLDERLVPVGHIFGQGREQLVVRLRNHFFVSHCQILLIYKYNGFCAGYTVPYR